MNGENDQLMPNLPPGARLLVVAAVGTGNVGDEAMLAGLLHRLGDRSRVTVVSADSAATRGLHEVDAVGPSSAMAALRKCNAVIIGGGSLFTDAMGARGHLIPLFGLAALAARKSVSLVGVSIDSSTPRAIRPLVQMLARRASDVRVRDAASAAILASWNVSSVVEPDLSTWMPAAPSQRARRLLAEAGLRLDRARVALCLNAVDPSLKVALLDAVPQVIAALPQVQFCLVPMSRHRTARHENDLAFAEELQRAAPNTSVLSAELHPAEMLGVVSAFDAAVCMRYHSFVFAHRAGVPIVGIPYAEKCRAWMAENDIVPCTIDASVMVAGILSALEKAYATGAQALAPGRQ